MKTKAKSVLLLVVVVFVLAAGLLVSRFFESSRDYREAEPLVKVIWPLADEMKRFSGERGRPPINLDELSHFSHDRDFSVLRAYPHEFSAHGPRRFFLRVNNRFAFTIDEQFMPNWSQPTSEIKGPTNRQ